MFNIDSTSLMHYISIAADLMTILGISGVFTWSFVKKEIQEQSVSDMGIGIFAVSIKLVLCFFMLCLIYITANFMHSVIILIFSGSYISSDGIWNSDKSIIYIMAYSICILLWIPISILCVSSIFTWSFGPFIKFARAFRNKKNAEQSGSS